VMGATRTSVTSPLRLDVIYEDRSGGAFFVTHCPGKQCSGTAGIWHRDLDTDEIHCGTCAEQCGWLEECVAGTCSAPVPSCESPLVDCSGRCRDLHTDEENCGACGNVCASGLVCRSGFCFDPGL
jgi:hypothetical protein